MRALFLLPLLLPVSAASAQVSLAPPKTVWDSDLDGTALHRISTLQCPTSSGAFRRINIQLYDKVGFDVGCDYRANATEITLYLTQINPADFDHHFEVARKAVVDNRPGAVSREGTLELPPGFEWRRASFQLQNSMFSDVLMAPFHGWYFEVRVTYRPENADGTAKALAELSALALKTAGQHLAACEAAPTVDRKGKLVSDSKENMSLAIVTGSLMGKMKVVDEVTGSSKEMTGLASSALSCAEDSFSIGNENYIYWHDMGTKGEVYDRITSLNGDVSIFTRGVVPLEAVTERGNAVTSGKLSSIAVIVDRKDSWDIVAFFDGMPDMQALATAALLGKGGILARVSKIGNRIELPPRK
jgi:hypothetical protein